MGFLTVFCLILLGVVLGVVWFGVWFVRPVFARLFREVVVSRGMVAAVVRAFESGDVVRLRGSDGVVRDVRVVAVGGEVDDV